MVEKKKELSKTEENDHISLKKNSISITNLES